MRARVVRHQIVSVVGRNEWHPGSARQLYQGLTNPLLCLKAVLLNLEKIITLSHDLFEFNCGSCGVVTVFAVEFEEIMGKGNYFLEIQEHGLEAQQRIRKPLVELSRRTGVPLVATNDAHYLMPDDARAHDVLLCIGSGKTVND